MNLSYGEWLTFLISKMKAENLKAWRTRPTTSAILARRERDRRYNATEKGRARGARYDMSAHGRATREAYEYSAAGIFSRAERRLRERAAQHGARLEMLTAELAAL
ncbi:MAG: hypothetical protein DMD96_00985 [Candidatus Rokuibacteriota bacterium]|nr:MAG: hypothetical protein DMD96_00985 [Candidatus Rokubacteria bacterium]